MGGQMPPQYKGFLRHKSPPSQIWDLCLSYGHWKKSLMSGVVKVMSAFSAISVSLMH